MVGEEDQPLQYQIVLINGLADLRIKTGRSTRGVGCPVNQQQCTPRDRPRLAGMMMCCVPVSGGPGQVQQGPAVPALRRPDHGLRARV